MRPCLTAVLAAALTTAPIAVAAQSIRGTVMDEADDRPLDAVHLVLLDSAGTTLGETLSDEDGWFVLAPPEPGRWIVAADLIGYGDMRSELLDVERGEQLTVEIRMAVEAVALEPLVVVGRISYMNGDLRSFYERMSRGRRSGLGDFISREDIENRGPLEASDLFRGRAGVRAVRGRTGYGAGLRMAGGCVPAIYIDGTHINRFNPYDSLDDYVAVQAIEGIEIYRGAGSQVDRFYDPRGCGLILVWTKRGVAEGEGRPFSWKRLVIGLTLLGGLLLLK
jgi:hypothetical protein